MNKALVLACGNLQRGDDGAALQVLNFMRKGRCDSATEFRFQQQWTPELAEPISQAEIVIFVDAATGTSPGAIACRPLQPSPAAPLRSTHYTSPESLLLLAHELYGKRPPRAYFVTITGASFEFEEALSDAVRRAVPRAGGRIEALLRGDTVAED